MKLSRILRSKVLLILFIMTFIWTASLFIAPMTISPNTVTDLDGNASRVDFAGKWNELPLYARVLYYIGDATCHQISERSFYINDNQMPVCARDIAIYMGLLFGFLAAMFIAYTTSPSKTFMNIFPQRLRNFFKKGIHRILFIILFIGLLFLPLAIDGSLQLLTDYESTNLLRVITGLPLGWAGGYIIGVLVATLGEIRRQDMMLRNSVRET